MATSAVLSYAAAYFSLIVAIGVFLRDRHAIVHRVFAIGMLLFAAEEALRAFSYGSLITDDVFYWNKRILAVSAIIPAFWLVFSLTYARADALKFLAQWKWVLGATMAIPVLLITAFRGNLLTGKVSRDIAGRWVFELARPGHLLALFVLGASILILFNLERTIRSSTGRMRWQIKFLALGVGGLFALRVYIASQEILFSQIDTRLGSVSSLALIAANVLFTLSLLRGSSLSVDVYLSTAAIRNSLTIVLAGVYLLVVGLLAKLLRSYSPSGSLPLDAFVVFLSLTVLGVLLLSNRLRRRLRMFVSEHFRRPIYDYRTVWMESTKRTTSVLDERELSAAVSKLVSESLEILSVSVWLADEPQRRLTLAGSTALYGARAREMEKAGKSAPDFIRFLREHPGCIDLADHELEWPREIMEAGKEFFRQHRMRYAVGLQARGEFVGIMTLNDDRVGEEGTLSSEDMVLLETLAAELASTLLNLRLSAHLRHAKEVETFQTVSTFFVHDLKNLASRLSLTMQNLPGNFDSPEFRADALRVISKSVSEIDEMCTRLSMLRGKIELKLDPCDLTKLVAQTLEGFKANLKADLQQNLHPLPTVRLDAGQIHKVLTNLVLNANEAVNGSGLIQVTTVHEGNVVGFSVRDNGCGMSEEFIAKSLFKPFQTTKKKGLGIGLFHCRLIVEAHRGVLEVNSSVGAGTEFRVLLPAGS
ncbi:MAG TPA: XrtA/PEP-CTERM system histidine kinase PrsK [Terriglobia bacterium]|nr:XrtA/PEP-CTERM system histidine kinase PrsK [Terriglobia bacterium]